jgi:hypothetical protein
MKVTENGNANFCSFAAEGKRRFVFLSRQMINGNQLLLIQQTSPSMVNINCVDLFLNKTSFSDEMLQKCSYFDF